MPTVGIACPFCCKTIDGAGLAAGARVRCSRCRAAFALRPEDLRTAALAAAAPPAPAPATPPAAVLIRPAPPAVVPPTRATVPSSAVWLLALGGGGAALLLLIAAAVGVALLFAAKRAPQVTVGPPPAPSPAAPTPDPAALPGSPDLHRKPLKEEPPAPKPPPVPDAPPPLSPPPDLKPDSPAAPKPTDLQDQVNQAIDRGVASLKSTQGDDGSWSYARGSFVGPTALAGLTLLECGVPADDAHVTRAAAFLRAKAPALHSAGETYELALVVLFLDRLGDPNDDPLLRTTALRLIAGQTPGGGWGYRCPVLEPKEEQNLLTVLRNTRPTTALELVAAPSGDAPSPKPSADVAEAAKKALDALPPTLRSLPALQPPTKDGSFSRTEGGDNSCTQFAMLGLWTARRHEVPMERALALVNQRFRLSQNEHGGWGYKSFGPAVGERPSMTAAGLLGLAVGHGVMADLTTADAPRPAGEDAAVEKGMKALGESIGFARGGKRNGPDLGGVDFYFLWSVERVGVLYGRKTIGGKEWYPWGAEMLVDNQGAEGAWDRGIKRGSAGAVDTSFALLFLKRSNPVRDLSNKLEFLTEDRSKGPGTKSPGYTDKKDP